MNAKVSVGMPTYNRPEFLAQAIESILNQTYRDLELLISDNASPNPEVRAICERYAAADPRVQYFRQGANVGAFNNFKAVYDIATAPFFMLGSDDDLWEPGFIERGVRALEIDMTKSAWFCQTDRINDAGVVIDTLKPISDYASKGNKLREVVYFLLESRNNAPKVMLTYSLFRRWALREPIDILLKCQSMKSVDNVFVYAFICRHDVAVDSEALFHKRRHALNPVSRAKPAPRMFLNNRHFAGYRYAAAGTRFAALTNLLLPVRYCVHLYENLRRSLRKRLGIKKAVR